jgi:hypothetical protein
MVRWKRVVKAAVVKLRILMYVLIWGAAKIGQVLKTSLASPISSKLLPQGKSESLLKLQLIADG